ncbi:MAG: hypothetical protein ABR985_12055 [Methanotrichaceae archaeon]
MKSLEPFEKRLEYLISGGKGLDEDTRSWLASLSPEELDEMSEIFIRHHQAGDLPYENLTSDEIAFLEPLFSRPVPSLPPIDRNEPVCQCCGNQPAVERGNIGEGFYWCDKCWQQVCPPEADERMANLPRDGHGNWLACGGRGDV